MEEPGVVLELQGELAVVQARRGQACEGCHAAGAGGQCACDMLGPERKLMRMHALNRANARPGDAVLISVGAPNVLKISLLLYVAPLVGLIGGALLGQYLIGRYALPLPSEVFVGLAGLLGLILVFALLRLVLRRLENRAEYMPVITRVLGSAGAGALYLDPQLKDDAPR